MVNYIKNTIKTLIITALFLSIAVLPGCTSESPNIEAPDRVEIDRTPDWQGALLYIADENGPTEGWGSIRIYDNVSGYVEKSVEQTLAAAPSDVFVSADQSSMYVASLANGRIDDFRWDGSNWHRSGKTVETPAQSLLTLVEGPDAKLYASDGAPPTGMAIFYVMDPNTVSLDSETLSFPEIEMAHGIAWSSDGLRAFVTGTDAGGAQLLLYVGWPSAQVTESLSLPMPISNQLVVSPDDKFLYVTGQGQIAKVDINTGAIAASLKPAPEADIDYTDADFSADGNYLFVTGTDPESDSTLYIIDLSTDMLVHSVKHISVKANGFQRVE